MSLRASLIFLSLVLTSVCTACHIPSPTVREFVASPALKAEQLCEGHISTAQFTLRAPSPLQGILECNERGAILVLTNEFHVRVRTITISKAGAIRDENSYLSPSSHSAERILSALSNVLHVYDSGISEDLVEIVQVTRTV